jgi:hypothetical protein
MTAGFDRLLSTIGRFEIEFYTLDILPVIFLITAVLPVPDYPKMASGKPNSRKLRMKYPQQWVSAVHISTSENYSYGLIISIGIVLYQLTHSKLFDKQKLNTFPVGRLSSLKI